MLVTLPDATLVFVASGFITERSIEIGHTLGPYVPVCRIHERKKTPVLFATKHLLYLNANHLDIFPLSLHWYRFEPN